MTGNQEKGLELCRRIENCSNNTIILKILNLREINDAYIWLTAGANGCFYVTGHDEIESRMTEYVRLYEERMEGEIRYSSDLMVNMERRRVFRGITEIFLTPQEYRVFSTLFMSPRQIVSDEILLRDCLEMPADVSSRSALSACLSRIRKKLRYHECK